jgi:hypothetical protein
MFQFYKYFDRSEYSRIQIFNLILITYPECVVFLINQIKNMRQ